MKSKIISILKLVIPACLGIYAAYFFYNKMDSTQKETFYASLQNANYLWIFLSAVLGMISHFLRAHRWKILLNPMGYSPKLSNSYHSVMIGYFINLIIPRGGEASRAGYLYKYEKVPFEKSFGTIVVERLIDVAMLGLIFCITFAMQFDKIDIYKEELNKLFIQFKGGNEDKAEISSWLFLAIGIGFIALVFIVLKLKPELKSKLIVFIKGLLDGLLSIFKLKRVGLFVLETFLIWGLYILMFWVAFCAIPETSNLIVSDALIAFIAGTIGVIIVPGGIGVYPILVATSLSISSNIEPEYGQAVGWIIWASQNLLYLTMGVLSMALISKTNKKYTPTHGA